METRVTEISEKIYHLSTYVPPADLRFNQVLIDADEPLLSLRVEGALSARIRRSFPCDTTEKLRWISYGHHEADESGPLNDWLSAAPNGVVALGEVGCMVTANDLAIREPRVLQDGEVLDLGGKRVRYLYTPHVPQAWDAGLLFEETTGTLLCGDLFTQGGDTVARTEADLIGPAFATEDLYGFTCLTPQTAPTIRQLAELNPKTLALMHGPAFQGNGKQALLDLAEGYEKRFQKSAGM